MGAIWTIQTWGKRTVARRGCDNDCYIYGYEVYWSGNSFFKALLKMREARKTETSCIVLEWRAE